MVEFAFDFWVVRFRAPARQLIRVLFYFFGGNFRWVDP
jgi:hypothetical protein